MHTAQLTSQLSLKNLHASERASMSMLCFVGEVER